MDFISFPVSQSFPLSFLLRASPSPRSQSTELNWFLIAVHACAPVLPASLLQSYWTQSFSLHLELELISFLDEEIRKILASFLNEKDIILKVG